MDDGDVDPASERLDDESYACANVMAFLTGEAE